VVVVYGSISATQPPADLLNLTGLWSRVQGPWR